MGPGAARQGDARRVMVSSRSSINSWRGHAGPGKARLGKVRRGMVYNLQKKMKEKAEISGKKGSHITKKKAVAYYKRFKQVCKQLGKDGLTAEELLDDAHDEAAPYHDFFNWDDTQAANEYRLYQARNLMRTIVKVQIITKDEEPREIRALLCVDISGEKRYVPNEIVFGDKALASQVIEEALKEVDSWAERYRSYRELSNITSAIDEELMRRGKKKKEALLTI
jgi:hypothetical protein